MDKALSWSRPMVYGAGLSFLEQAYWIRSTAIPLEQCGTSGVL